MATTLEPVSEERVCPYLRGRRQPQPLLVPSTGNHCILAASIHLPQSQQTRYCLGGRYRSCPRFERQQDRPLPRYVTGVASAEPPPPVAPAPLRVLPWRHPLGRQALRLLILLLAAAILVLAWRWRASTLTRLEVTRPPLPTAIASPTDTTPSPYLPPTTGPRPRP